MEDLRQIWLPLSDRFYRVAYHLLESEADAEDAVQELYLRLLDAGDSLPGITNPIAYGITLLKNICIDKIRLRSRRKAEQIETKLPFDGAPPDRLTLLKDTLHHLLKEIDRLPDKQAKVLKMRCIDGLEYSEISNRTGLSEVNIRVLISMARKTLKHKLNHEVDRRNRKNKH